MLFVCERCFVRHAEEWNEGERDAPQQKDDIEHGKALGTSAYLCVRLRANVVRVKVHLHAEGGVSVGEPEAKGRKRAVIPSVW